MVEGPLTKKRQISRSPFISTKKKKKEKDQVLRMLENGLSYFVAKHGKLTLICDISSRISC